MLSIIICSKTEDISTELKTNIQETIGLEHELIVIDNSKNNYSIFEAFNKGIDKSKGEILCFLHDDIFISTQNWGGILNDLFNENVDVGMIGIAGTKLKTRMPSAWWDCPQPFRAANLIQHIGEKSREHWNYGFSEKLDQEVVAIDGVFMAVRKDKRINFNENLEGFHNYDVSLCIDYRRFGYRVLVTNRILLEHFSLGTLDRKWYESTVRFHELYKNHLPEKTVEVAADVASRQEFYNGRRFIRGLIENKMRGEALKLWIKLFKIRPVTRDHFDLLKFLLFR